MQNTTKALYLGYDDLDAIMYKCCNCEQLIGVSIHDICSIVGDTCPNCNKKIEGVIYETYN